ncbi:PcfJ domain-containing protein [Limnobacter sp. YS8-69]|uniref:PcfJ domain-containing protein n=2 Tax=Limnobacter parvus TaxID=2939690 RepID=A0ABT1XIA6_9BURK|nr:PcfJ domain-containing protein [Limnobacter parvus]
MRLPARFVSTRSGLYFEWGMRLRVKLAESSPVLLDDSSAWNLKAELMRSIWQPPPSIRVPEEFQNAVLNLPIESVSLKDVQRAWSAAIRRRFGYEVFKLSLRVLPRKSTLFDLSQVAAFKHVLNARLLENPALAPLLAQDRGMWSNLPNWRVVKNRMLAQGLSQHSWRWLTHQKKAYIARIDWGQLSHLSWVNFHSALAREVPISWVDKQTAALLGFGGLGTWLRRNHEDLNTMPALNILRGVRLALQRRQSTDKLAHRHELAHEEFPLITDWLLGSAAGSGKQRVVISRHWTYDTLMSRQVHWHLVELDLEMGRPNVFWPEVIGMGSLGNNIDFIELTSLNALLSEAKKMHHCVPSYIDRCMAGDVCIFHLQIKGHAPQRGTLEFRREGASGWQISQLKGPCNSPVSSQLWSAAHVLLSRLG